MTTYDLTVVVSLNNLYYSAILYTEVPEGYNIKAHDIVNWLDFSNDVTIESLEENEKTIKN